MSYTKKEIIELEKNTGKSEEQLIDIVGKRCSEKFRQLAPSPKKVLIICGKGNNGQDGLSVASNIQDEYEVKIILLNDNIDYSRYRLHCPILNKEHLEKEINNCEVIIDCIFGFSFHLPLNDEYRDIIQSINRAQKTVISMDLNSGTQCDDGLYEEAVISDYTFILGARKHVHDLRPELSKKQIMIDIFR